MASCKTIPEKSVTLRSRRWRIKVGAGLLIAFLLALPAAGTSWASFPLAGSQLRGGDASYDEMFQQGLDMLRRHRWEEALKAFKRANEMRNQQRQQAKQADAVLQNQQFAEQRANELRRQQMQQQRQQAQQIEAGRQQQEAATVRPIRHLIQHRVAASCRYRDPARAALGPGHPSSAPEA